MRTRKEAQEMFQQFRDAGRFRFLSVQDPRLIEGVGVRSFGIASFDCRSQAPEEVFLSWLMGEHDGHDGYVPSTFSWEDRDDGGHAIQGGAVDTNTGRMVGYWRAAV
jgi:hypothetical protein